MTGPEKIKHWRVHPEVFVTEELKAEPDAWQLKALKAVADPTISRISLQACAGPGKSALLAWIGWWFLSCFGDIGEHPKGAAVSITADNLKDNLWAELSKWRDRSEWLKGVFEWTKERIFAKHHPETWFISFRSWAKVANAEEQGKTLSGLHSKYVLHLIDESGGIPLAVCRAAEQALSNCVWGKIIQAGNPISHDGMLYAAATTQRHLWHVIIITGDPADTERSPRIDREWAQAQIDQYGKDNPWVMGYILGKFPPASINTLLGPDEVEEAMKRTYKPEEYQYSQKRIGVDAARFGDDPWVLFPRQGLAAFKPIELRHPRSDEVAARLGTAKERWGWEMSFFDDTGGYAAGAIDSCIQAGYPVTPINFAGMASDQRYYNKRAEMWFKMAEWVKRGGALPRLPGLVAELTVPTYTFSKGKFIMEDKDQVKKRIGRSPNYADALALTFSMVEMPSDTSPQGLFDKFSSKMKSDWDPMEEMRKTPKEEVMEPMLR